MNGFDTMRGIREAAESLSNDGVKVSVHFDLINEDKSCKVWPVYILYTDYSTIEFKQYIRMAGLFTSFDNAKKHIEDLSVKFVENKCLPIGNRVIKPSDEDYVRTFLDGNMIIRTYIPENPIHLDQLI